MYYYLCALLLSFPLFTLQAHRSCDVPIIPQGPHYYDKPFWEIGKYDDLTVYVGDTLVFYFLNGLHDVHVFDEDHHQDWAGCQFTDTVNVGGIFELPSIVTKDLINVVGLPPSPVSQGNFTFTNTTIVYFACGGGGGTHCLDGQKFGVKVLPQKIGRPPKVWYPQYQKQALWTLLGYPDLKVSKGDRLIFKYDPVSTVHDVWLMAQPCSLNGATQIGDQDDGAGEGLVWSAKCPNGVYPCSVFLGCSCRPVGALGMSNEGCGLSAGTGPLLHCSSGMGFHVNITRY